MPKECENVALENGMFADIWWPKLTCSEFPFESEDKSDSLIGLHQRKTVKGQLQRFYKLISNDRIWPSEHGFEVIFEKSLFVFEISAFKVRNKRGIHSRFHSFSENNNRKTLRLWRHKWSKLHDQYRAQWLTWPQSKWKLLSLMVFGRNYDSLCCLWLFSDSRMTKGISFYKFQANNERRMHAVTTWGASSSKTTPNLIIQS